jgi:hypothetical protein
VVAPWKIALPVLVLAMAIASAAEKTGMPDLMQVENTCLPTSTANLVIWFGHHGYPNLILSGDTDDDRNLHVVHRMMENVHANFDEGTWMRAVPTGIKQYINDAGYDCDIEYRGIGSDNPFSADWLNENDDPKKGFILILNYCHHDESSDTYTNALDTGHVVTLVSNLPDLLVIQDPAHEQGESGRKIVTPTVITSGALAGAGFQLPAAGFLRIDGTMLWTPPDAEVMVTGAVCITMRGSLKDALAAKAAAAKAAATGSSTGTQGGWLAWIINLFLGK